MVLEDADKGNLYSEMLNCQLGAWPIKYLGVSVSGSRLHVAHMRPMNDKLLKKLDGWVGNDSSIGG